MVVNKLARAVTKWTKACDKRLARLISYIHHTCEFRQYCYVGNTAQQCRLGLFQDSDFTLTSQNHHQVDLCIFGSQTFVPISCMCKKQTSVSHSSTEAKLISLDAGSRMDGIPALDLRDLVIEVFHSSPNQSKKTKDQARGDSSRNTTSNKHTQNRTKVPTKHNNLESSDVDYVSSNAKSFFICCDDLHFCGQWSRDQHDNKKAEVPQRDMCQGPMEFLLIGCLTEIIWTPRFRLGSLTPNINSQTFWPQVSWHVLNGTIFFICSTSAISPLLAALRIPVW